MPWATLKLVEEQLAQNGNTVRPVERNGTQVEDGRNRDVAAQTNEVDQNADERVQPHGEHWRIGLAPDLVPNPATGQHLVTAESPNGTGTSLERGDADKVHDDKGGHGEEDGRAFTHDVVVDLHDGLLNHAGENVLGRVVGGEIEGPHAESQDDVEEPAYDVGEAQGGGDGRRDGHGGVLGLFGNVRRGIVIGHGPGDRQETKQEAESRRGPARVGLDLGENVACSVLVLLHDKEGYAAGKEHNDVNHRIGPRNLG